MELSEKTLTSIKLNSLKVFIYNLLSQFNTDLVRDIKHNKYDNDGSTCNMQITLHKFLLTSNYKISNPARADFFLYQYMDHVTRHVWTRLITKLWFTSKHTILISMLRMIETMYGSQVLQVAWKNRPPGISRLRIVYFYFVEFSLLPMLIIFRTKIQWFFRIWGIIIYTFAWIFFNSTAKTEISSAHCWFVLWCSALYHQNSCKWHKNDNLF